MLKSVLQPDPLRPGAALPMSVGLHVVVAAALLLGGTLSGPPKPLIDPDEVLEVSLMPMPKQTTRQPQKASRTPDPVQGAVEPTTAPPTPPSDATMSLNDPKAPKPEGDPKAREKERQELMDQMRRDQSRRDALAALGSEDRLATSEDGVEGATGSSTGVGDPKKAMYGEKVKQAILPNFSTISTNPKLKVLVSVTIDGAGMVKGFEVKKSSNDPSFDAAALRAVAKTVQVPQPSAEVLGGSPPWILNLSFSPSDVQ
jgi:TonB family protein